MDGQDSHRPPEAAVISMLCPMCGRELELGAAECPGCGEALGARRREFTPAEVERFRNEMRAVAVLWTLFGVGCLVVGLAIIPQGGIVQSLFLLAVGGGFLACAWEGLRYRAGTMSWGAAAWLLLTVGFCVQFPRPETFITFGLLTGIPLLLVILPQLFRCCRFEARLRTAGLPPTVSPSEFDDGTSGV